jgi:hypothetical protein
MINILEWVVRKRVSDNMIVQVQVLMKRHKTKKLNQVKQHLALKATEDLRRKGTHQWVRALTPILKIHQSICLQHMGFLKAAETSKTRMIVQDQESMTQTKRTLGDQTQRK